MTTLILRRAMLARVSGNWQREDYDVFDGERKIGRIYMVDVHGQDWFWDLSANSNDCKSGHAGTLEEAKAAFRNEYLEWIGTAKGSPG
jgi:hypothetical protein